MLHECHILVWSSLGEIPVSVCCSESTCQVIREEDLITPIRCHPQNIFTHQRFMSEKDRSLICPLLVSPSRSQSFQPANESRASICAEIVTTLHDLMLLLLNNAENFLNSQSVVRLVVAGCHPSLRHQMGVGSGCLPSRLKH